MTERERFEKVFPSPKVAEDAYQALQDELIQIQATIESFATPAAALSALIDWHVAVATDPRVNGGRALVPVDDLDVIAEVVRGMLHTAYQNAMPVCCGKPGQQCCGNPDPEWSAEDMKVMDSLGPVEKRISAMLAAA